MNLFNKLFVTKELFQNFSISEKRELLNWDLFFLENEKKRRQGKIKVIDLTGAQKIAKRLSDNELNRLVEIRNLTSKADSISGSKAITLYKKVALLAPWDEISLMSIGVEYAQAGNFQKSIQWLGKALKLNPENERVRKNFQSVKAAAKQ